ncbi:glyoxalase/bleomycin resistance/extradiol dioxygenase family protein [Sphingobium sp. LB126]|jgi:2,3-dihydroxy-p-cumate/2,3-dihydroxybenzoate 3,4-dioxygenase|uniref:VOC family protein n=1 Tax=Sphingobium TaxID=165695 RepID=UPI000C20CB41|nr:VOC family protein [Sphingobium sp. LB126]PJG45557.1 glyoxalase/bleomycin resistance/extradiol dioxygenase family protein [Sphingobium sp. LB126]
MGTDLHDISYVRIGSEDLDESVRFATHILGLELMGRDASSAYLRGDSRDHNIVYTKGRSSGHVVGFELPSMAAIDAAAAQFEQAGINVRQGTSDEREQRRALGLITLTDPTGNVIDLVAQPAASGRRYFGARDAGITSFSHIGLRTSDPRIDERFWTTMLNAKVSDWIGEAPLLRIDEVHHKVALFPSSYAGIQHVNFQVESIDDIMRSYYFLQTNNVKIVFGPGRHPTSGARFLYFQGPDNIIYEYSTGVRMITADDEKTYVPRQFPMAPTSFCMWGSLPDIPEFKTKAAASGDGLSNAA